VLAIDAGKRARNPAGLLIRQLEDGNLPPFVLTAGRFCELVNAGHVSAVNGKPVKRASVSGASIEFLMADGTFGVSRRDKVRDLPMTLGDLHVGLSAAPCPTSMTGGMRIAQQREKDLATWIGTVSSAEEPGCERTYAADLKCPPASPAVASTNNNGHAEPNGSEASTKGES
jgi:hypothetical protein